MQIFCILILYPLLYFSGHAILSMPFNFILLSFQFLFPAGPASLLSLCSVTPRSQSLKYQRFITLLVFSYRFLLNILCFSCSRNNGRLSKHSSFIVQIRLQSLQSAYRFFFMYIKSELKDILKFTGRQWSCKTCP